MNIVRYGNIVFSRSTVSFSGCWLQYPESILGGFLLLGELESTPEKLLCYIQDNPGCHLRRIKRVLGISMGNLQYQLEKLEKMGKITSTRRGLYKYFFPAGLFKEGEKDILEILTHETARKILMFIIEQKSPTQIDIVDSVGISARTVGWHVGRLIDLAIIRDQGRKIQKI